MFWSDWCPDGATKEELRTARGAIDAYRQKYARPYQAVEQAVVTVECIFVSVSPAESCPLSRLLDGEDDDTHDEERDSPPQRVIRKYFENKRNQS